MFFSPGEFEIEDESSYDKAVRYVKKLSLEPPKILSCKLRLLVVPIKTLMKMEMKTS